MSLFLYTPASARSHRPRRYAPSPAVAPAPRGDLEAAELRYHRRRELLTRAEMAFYRQLRSSLPPGCVAFAKVRLADLLNCDADAWRRGGYRIGAKHLDFVICDGRDSSILLAVELDDRTHLHPSRRDRDLLLVRSCRSAGVPLLRVAVAPYYDRVWLRSKILDLLPGPPADDEAPGQRDG